MYYTYIVTVGLNAAIHFQNEHNKKRHVSCHGFSNPGTPHKKIYTSERHARAMLRKVNK